MNNLTHNAGQGQKGPTQVQIVGSTGVDPTHDAELGPQLAPIVSGAVGRLGQQAATVLVAMKSGPGSDDGRDAFGRALRLGLEHAVTPPAPATPALSWEDSRNTALLSPMITRQQQALLATLGSRGEPTEAQFVKLRHIVGVVT